MNNFYGNPYFQPYQPQQQPYMQQQEPPFIVATVNGIGGANAYQVPAGRKAILLDSNNSMFYFKMANEMGQATVKAYDFQEHVDTPAPTPAYLTREDVEEMIKNALATRKSSKSE